MAAATTDINTPRRSGAVLSMPLAAATILFGGTLVAKNPAGNLVPASNTAGLVVVGVIEQTVDNRDGAAGDLSGNVQRGVFAFANSNANPLTKAEVGKFAFVEDNQTVGSTGTNKVKAGRIVEVNAEDGVWIDTSGAAIIPLADTITGSADLAALKTNVLAILQTHGLVI